jgi:hypothetical protein
LTDGSHSLWHTLNSLKLARSFTNLGGNSYQWEPELIAGVQVLNINAHCADRTPNIPMHPSIVPAMAKGFTKISHHDSPFSSFTDLDLFAIAKIGPNEFFSNVCALFKERFLVFNVHDAAASIFCSS